MLKRNGTALEAWLADNSTYTNFVAAGIGVAGLSPIGNSITLGSDFYIRQNGVNAQFWCGDADEFHYNQTSNYWRWLIGASQVAKLDANGLFLGSGGSGAANERLTVDGAISLQEMIAPSHTDGYGKIYVQGDGNLYYKDQEGNETNLLVGEVEKTGSPADNQVATWTDANTITGESTFTYDGAGALVVSSTSALVSISASAGNATLRASSSSVGDAALTLYNVDGSPRYWTMGVDRSNNHKLVWGAFGTVGSNFAMSLEYTDNKGWLGIRTSSPNPQYNNTDDIIGTSWYMKTMTASLGTVTVTV